jgi:hypothetical protein
VRINVYAEELTTETTVIEKMVDGRRFFGIRLFLKSPQALHQTELDDDRSAITFWVPWWGGKNHHEELIDVLSAIVQTAWDARKRDEK